MKYCELDDFFSQYVLPFVRDVLNCHYYRWHLNQLKSKGVYDSICKIIDDERVIIRTKLEKPSKIKGLALI